MFGPLNLSWATNPIGALFASMVEGAAMLVSTLFTWLLTLTEVNFLNAEWLETYDVALWIAMLSFAFMWIWTAVALATRQVSGRTAFNRLVVGTVLFMILAPLGPTIAHWLGKLFSAMTRDLLTWGVTSSAEDVGAGIAERVGALDMGGTQGGQMLGIVLLVGVILALLGMLLMSVLIALLQYIGWALFPVAVAFFVSARHNSLARKAAAMLLVLFLTLPLMMFVLVVVFKITGGIDTQNPAVEIIATGQTDFGKDMALLVTMLLGLGVAALAPLSLMAWVTSHLQGSAAAPASNGGGGEASSGPTSSQDAASSVNQTMTSGGSGGSAGPPGAASGGPSSGAGAASAAGAAPTAGGGAAAAGAGSAGAGAAAGAGGGAAAAGGGVAAGVGSGAAAGAVGGPAGAAVGAAAGAAVGSGAGQVGNVIQEAHQNASSQAQQLTYAATMLSQVTEGQGGGGAE